MSKPTVAIDEHTPELQAIHRSLMASSGLVSRYLEPFQGERAHVLVFGQGKPLVMLHGSGPTSLQLLPLITELSKRHVLAVDRPGFGLSDPHSWPADRRQASVDWIDSILDSLELDRVGLLGSSAGGTWSIWYALAHPERIEQLVVVGAPPGLSVTTPPEHLRMAASIDPANPPPLPPPSRETVIQSMSGMGEGETIARYPEQIDAMVASGRDPLSGQASLDELQALIADDGWQPDVRTNVNELGGIAVPTLVVWGDRDPLGGKKAAEQVASAIPQSRLEMLDAGHGPWLGHPRTIAELISDHLGH